MVGRKILGRLLPVSGPSVTRRVALRHVLRVALVARILVVANREAADIGGDMRLSVMLSIEGY